ncbi:MAG TPA: ATP-binding protein [Planctomycetota bacterium]|nr:ATP-binding protein [Planctomycetota bacterium]
MTEELEGIREQGPLPCSLVKDILFIVDLLAHAGAGEVDLSLRGTPYVVVDRWALRRLLLRSLLPLLPAEPGLGSLRLEVAIETGSAVVRAAHPARCGHDFSEPARIARAMGGELSLAREQGGGTSVTIRVPVAAIRTPRPHKESSCATTERTSPCA